MSAGEAFFDTSVLLYLFLSDGTKADRAEKLVAKGGVISVQVLSEFTSVTRRKLALSRGELREALDSIRALCRIEPVTEQTYEAALEVAGRYNLHWYDAMIVGAALLAECSILYSEDMHRGLRIRRGLRVVIPFR